MFVAEFGCTESSSWSSWLTWSSWLSWIKGEPHEIFDLMGKDTTLFHHAGADPESIEGQYVAQAATWFESMWSTITRPFPEP
jgi:hypothetical protein